MVKKCNLLQVWTWQICRKIEIDKPLLETIYIPSESSNKHLDSFFMSIGFIESFFHGELNSSMIVQELKLMAGPDLQNMMKN